MARRARAVRPAELPPVELHPDGAAPLDDEWRVEEVPQVIVQAVATSRFVTIGENSTAWGGAAIEVASLKGAFVRIRPPKGIPEQQIADVEGVARGVALGVKVERPRKDAVVAEKKAREPHRSARMIVEAMVAGANTKDRGALEGLVEQVMAEEKL
jgi:hypothetical protein